MKKFVLFVLLWFSMFGWGLAQVQPEAQALIDKAIVAHGGRAAIDGINTMLERQVGWYMASDGQKYTIAWQGLTDVIGRRYRYERIVNATPYAAGQETEAGAFSWSSDGGLRSLEQNSLFHYYSAEIWKRMLLPLRSAEVLGTRSVFGVTGMAVTFKVQNRSGDFTYLLADDGTILAVALESDITATGTSFLFGDYRDVAGVRLFFSFRVVRNGQLVEDFRVLETKVNLPLSDALFIWPPVIPETPTGRIGIVFEPMSGQGLKVSMVTKEMPAAKAGVREGDLIVAVDGLSMVDWNDFQADTIRGKPGTIVVLTIKRGDQILKISITRASL
jgi:PDZ domain